MADTLNYEAVFTFVMEGIAEGTRDVRALQQVVDESYRSGVISERQFEKLSKTVIKYGSAIRTAGSDTKRAASEVAGSVNAWQDLEAAIHKADAAWRSANQNRVAGATGDSFDNGQVDPGGLPTDELRRQQAAYDSLRKTREQAVREELAQRDESARSLQDFYSRREQLEQEAVSNSLRRAIQQRDQEGEIRGQGLRELDAFEQEKQRLEQETFSRGLRARLEADEAASAARGQEIRELAAFYSERDRLAQKSEQNQIRKQFEDRDQVLNGQAENLRGLQDFYEKRDALERQGEQRSIRARMEARAQQEQTEKAANDRLIASERELAAARETSDRNQYLGTLSAEERAKEELERANEGLANSEKELDRARKAGDVDAETTANKQLADAIKQVDRAQENYNRTLKVGDAASDGYNQRLTSLRYAMFDVGQTLAGISAATIGGGGLLLSSFAEFESGMTSVSRTTGATGADLEALEGSIRGLALEIPIGTDELVQIATAAGQLGVAQADIESFTETIATFAAISDSLDAEQAGLYLARIAQLTGTSDFRGIATAIAELSDTLPATDQQIAQTAQEVARASAVIGLSADEVLGLSTAFAALGIAPEQARSVLFQFSQNIEDAFSGANDNLGAFEQLLGRTGAEVEALYRTDPAGFLVEFSDALSRVDPDSLSNALNDLGIDGARALPAFAALSQNIRDFGLENSALVTGLSTAETAFGDITGLAEKMAPFIETLSGQWQLLMNELEEVAIVVGELVAPFFKEMIEVAREGLEAFRAYAESDYGQSFLLIATKITTLVAALATIGAPLALMSGGTLAVVSAIQILRPQVQGLLVNFRLLHTQSLVTASGMGLAGRSAAVAAVGMTGLSVASRLAAAALKAVGIAALIMLITDPINFFNGLLGLTVDLTFGIAGGLLGAAQGVFSFVGSVVSGIPGLGNFAAALQIVAQQIATILTFLPQIGNVFKQQARDTFGLNIQKTNEAVSGLNDSSSEATDIMAALDAAMGEAAASTGDFGDAAGGGGGDGGAAGKVDDLARKVRTLVDYAGDLQGVFSRAFEIRFSGQNTYDSVTESFFALTERFDAATLAIRDLRQQINELNADMGVLSADISKQQYFLSIAVEYGDDARAEQIRARIAELEAELAGKRNDLADKTKDLANEEQNASKSLIGNSKAAIQNRKALTGLVSQYGEHLTALASSGKSQEEVAQAAQALKQEFLEQARAMGYSEAELAPYAAAFDDLSKIIANVPRDVTIEFNGDPALTALNEFLAKIEEVNSALGGMGGGGIGGGGIGGGGGGFDWGNFFGDPTEDLRELGQIVGHELVKPLRNRGALRSVRKSGEDVWQNLMDGLARAAEKKPTYEFLDNDPHSILGISDREFAYYWEQNLGLDIAVTRLGPKINSAMRNHGRTSQREYLLGFEQSLDLRPILSRAGDSAAPALRSAGTRSGGFFREGFAATSSIGDLIGNSAGGSTESFRGTGQRAGHSMRYGFSETSYTYDLVAQSARNAGTSDFYGAGWRAGDSFRSGFRSMGALDIAIEVPGVKVNNNGLGKMRFFSAGGYTGAGGKYAPAGIVHKGEYVIPKRDVNQSTGLPYADALGRLQRGSRAQTSFASGGYAQGGGSGTQMVRLDAASVQAVARAVQPHLILDGREVAGSTSKADAFSSHIGAN